MFKRIMCCCCLLLAASGCCILSRNISGPTRVVTSDFYHSYTNGNIVVSMWVIDKDGNKIPYSYHNECICYKTSYVGGPWRGSDLYPGTRYVLNILSGWSYSSAASGNYMNNLITLPTYPIYIVELPIQLALDTVLIPFDWLNTPSCPEGYQKEF